MLGFHSLAGDAIASRGGLSPVVVTGVSATGSVTSVVVSLPKTVVVTSVSATGGVGSVTLSLSTNVSVTGVSATGGVGSVNVWGIITPSQSPSYSAISPSQSPSYSAVTPSQSLVGRRLLRS